MAHQYGIEMAEVIPGFAARFDSADLVRCMAPRRVLIVSATNDAASQDADMIMEIVQRVLGHRDIRSTQGYAELDHQQVREALELGARR